MTRLSQFSEDNVRRLAVPNELASFCLVYSPPTQPVQARSFRGVCSC